MNDVTATQHPNGHWTVIDHQCMNYSFHGSTETEALQAVWRYRAKYRRNRKEFFKFQAEFGRA